MSDEDDDDDDDFFMQHYRCFFATSTFFGRIFMALECIVIPCLYRSRRRRPMKVVVVFVEKFYSWLLNTYVNAFDGQQLCICQYASNLPPLSPLLALGSIIWQSPDNERSFSKTTTDDEAQKT
jgi:hypothetical protein